MQRRRALLLTTSRSPTEMEELVFALGADLVGTIYQRRLAPDPQTYLGSGKLEEAREAQRGVEADLIVVDAALKPGQIFGLQRFFRPEASSRGRRSGPDVEVYDRTRLILEIFRERARSQEARLQVELATLQYEMPLVKEMIHREKRGERQAAMFGSGEYAADVEYDRMKRRIARIREELEKVRRERAVRRKHRRRGGFHLVSLAGYTNAGKSSLLRALSSSDTLVENRYFSTLSTKTARAAAARRDVLVTDTVGFIEDLPPWMVEAFHSTLEEVAEADVIVLVVDASDPVEEMARRLRSSLRVLHEFERLGPMLVAFNKADRLSAEEISLKTQHLAAEGLIDPRATLPVSAAKGTGLDVLHDRIVELIPHYVERAYALPASAEAEAALGWLYDEVDVIAVERDARDVVVRVEVALPMAAAVEARVRGAGGRLLAVPEAGAHEGDAVVGRADAREGAP